MLRIVNLIQPRKQIGKTWTDFGGSQVRISPESFAPAPRFFAPLRTKIYMAYCIKNAAELAKNSGKSCATRNDIIAMEFRGLACNITRLALYQTPQIFSGYCNSLLYLRYFREREREFFIYVCFHWWLVLK